MILTISRFDSNCLYTEGQLRVNGQILASTVEASDVMLPNGCYTLVLVKKNAHCRELVIEGTPWRIGITHSFIGSRKDKIVGIGTPLIPGSLFKSAPDYERLVKRLEKCQMRKESMELVIEDSQCVRNHPFTHWLNVGLLVLSVFVLFGCTCHRQVEVVKEMQHDTLYLSRLQYDSVYIEHEKIYEPLDTAASTLPPDKGGRGRVLESHIEYRYKLLRDTVRIVRIDSVPLVRTVVETVERRYVPPVYKWSLAGCICIIILVIIYVRKKIKT